MRKILYLNGDTVGVCTFVREEQIGVSKKIRFATFMCQCGKEFISSIDKVKRLHTKSCGCLFIEKLIERNTTHGMSCSPEYRNWKHMVERCKDPENKKFKNWAGKGVVVCPEWNNSFEQFFKDIGPRPSKNHSLDRFPNKEGDYELSNCRWATPKQQANNTNHNFNIEYQGITKTLMEWADILKLNYHSVKVRLRKLNWSVEKAFTTPIKQYKCLK